MLLTANYWLNTAYVLKEQFGHLWSYRNETWTWRFFTRCTSCSAGNG